MAWRIVFDECLTKILEIFDLVSLNIPKVRILATIRVIRITISKNNMPIQGKEISLQQPLHSSTGLLKEKAVQPLKKQRAAHYRNRTEDFLMSSKFE